MNEIYFKLFVLPFLDRIEAPAIKKNSFHELEIYALEQQGSEAAFKEDKKLAFGNKVGAFINKLD